MRVRIADPSDLPALMELDQECSSGVHWSRQQYASLLAPIQGDAAWQRYAWVAEDESGTLLPMDMHSGQRINGFLVARRIGRECELENVIVSPGLRRQGVATLLIRGLMVEAREMICTNIFLEVRKSNLAARCLYEKFGFLQTGLRKNYYQHPQEDAVLYSLGLC